MTLVSAAIGLAAIAGYGRLRRKDGSEAGDGEAEG
jgi:hypothetical protein